MDCRRAFIIIAAFFLASHDALRCTHIPSPPGILFVRDESVWQSTIDGSAQKEIIKVGVDERYFWIPKVRRLIVAGLDDYTTARIKIIDLDSAKIDTVHTETLDGGNDETGSIYYFTISVSKDGDKIAYGGSFGPADETVVYTSSAKLSRRFKCPSAMLSPDGQTLAWVRDNNMYLTSLKDGSVEQLPPDSNAESGAGFDRETVQEPIAWSHDGLRVFCYFGNRGHAGTFHIWVVDVRTHKAKRLTQSRADELEYFLEESLDSRYVYFSVMGPRDSDKSLRRVDIQSTQVYEIKPSDLGDFKTMYYQVGSLSSSPNLLAYEWYEEDGGGRKPVIFVMDPTGANAHKLIDRAAHPKWMLRQ